MTSESTSAVLDLNDGDLTEDTEPPSVSDDGNDGVPLIMEHGQDIVVKVDAPMKQLSTLETFVTYRVRCVCARWPAPPAVRRRYNHFRALHKRLAAEHPWLAVPPLPPHHSPRQQLDRYSPSFVACRTLALDAFLSRVARHPILSHSAHLRAFLTAADPRLPPDPAPPLPPPALRAAPHARVKDPEFSSAADYLTSLQSKLSALCALTVKLHKGSAALGTELMGMKRACDAWATQAGGAVAAGAGACARGAGGAGGARGGPAPLRARAALPLLSAYAQAHLDKIRQRDAIHAAYISGNNTGDLHNKLEQASEALRSELSDWIPQTRAEVKGLLLELAERQVSTLAQTLRSWEDALHMQEETNVAEMFKTVSAAAVQSLSPSRGAASPASDRRGDPLQDELDFDDSKDTHADTPTSDPSEDGPSDPLREFADVDLSS